MEFVMPIISGGAGGWLGWLLVRTKRLAHYLASIVVVLAIGGWLFAEGRAATGWDGIGYALLLVLGAAPCFLGLLIGGLVGYLKRLKTEQS